MSNTLNGTEPDASAANAEETITLTFKTGVLSMSGLEAMISLLEQAKDRICNQPEPLSKIIQADRYRSIEFYEKQIKEFCAAKEELTAKLDEFVNAREEVNL